MRYQFADCELDTGRHLLTRSGEIVALEPQVFDLLALLLERAGDLVSHDEIISGVWGGRIVSDATVASRISAVRKAIGDNGTSQRLLKTVHRRGFRLSVPVRTDDAEPSETATGGQDIRIASSTDGTAIAWTTTGRGPPLLRAGHFLTHLEQDWVSPIWRPLLDRLGKNFSLTRYDQRGTGLSDTRADDFSIERLVEDLGTVADAAGLDRFPIFASSQGVPVSVAFAARHSDRVSRMVLYGGYAQGRSLRDDAEDRAQAEAIATFIRTGWGQSGTAFARAFATTFMPDATSEQIADLTRMQLASATPANALALRRAIDAFDVTDLLPDVTCPVLVLHCREDAVHPVSQARVLAAGLPDASVHVFEGRNHIPIPGDPAWEQITCSAIEFLSA